MAFRLKLLRVLTTVASLFLAPQSSRAASWSANSPGDLLSGSNWAGGVAPNGLGQVAEFTTQPTSAGDFTLNGAMTLTTLIYSNPEARSITGSGTLNINITTGTPEISITGGTLSIDTTISGPQGLLKTGTGKLILSGTNTYTGTTFISGGTLSGDTIANQGVSSAFGAGATGFNLSNAATLEYTGASASTDRAFAFNSGGGTISVTNAATELILTNNPSGSGGFVKTGAGVLTLTVSSSHSGLNSVFGGTLSGNTIANSGVNSVFGRGNFVLSNGATLQYTGATNSTNRSLVLDSSGAVSVTNSATVLTLTGNNVSGVGGLTKTGAGALYLTGSNNYSGLNTILGGELHGNTIANQGVDSSFGRGNFAIENGATLRYTGPTASTDRTITLGAGGGSIQVLPGNTLTLNGVISGPGRLVKSTTGTLVLNANNTYGGSTIVGNGVLQLGGSERLPDGTAVRVDTTFNLNNFNETIGSLAGEGNVTLGSGALTTGGDGTSTDFAGIISGAGGWTKTGAGVMTLSGINNSYTGMNTISGGTLSGSKITNFNTSNSSFGRGNFALSNGGTFEYTGTSNDTNRAFDLGTGGGVISVTEFDVALDTNGVISGVGGLTKAGNGLLHLNAANTYSGGTIVNSGTVVALNASGSATGSGDITLNTFSTLQIGNGGTGGAVSGNIIGAESYVTFNRSNNLTYAGQFSGDFLELMKLGAGKLTLTGESANNAFTYVFEGTLEITDGGSLSTGNRSGYIGGKTGSIGTAIVGGGTGNSSWNISDVSIGSFGGGTLNIIGGGSVNSTFASIGGALDSVANVGGGIGASSWSISNFLGIGSGAAGASLNITGGGNVTSVSTYIGSSDNPGTLTVGGGTGAATFTSSSIQVGSFFGNDASTLNINANGIVTTAGLFGGNAYSSIRLNGGMLRITSDNAAWDQFILQAGGGIIDVPNAGTTFTATGSISGGVLTKTGAGAMTIVGNNSYAGVDIAGGTLSGNSVSFGASPSAFGSSFIAIGNGGTMKYTGATAGTDRILSLYGVGGTVEVSNSATTLFAQQQVVGFGALTKSGPGEFVLNNNNFYQGGTILSGGTLTGNTLANAGFSSAFGLGHFVIQNGATLRYGGANAGTNRLISLGPGGGAIDVANGGTVMSLTGLITAAGGLTKNGNGQLAIYGANDYAGGTTINGGHLYALNSAGSATGSGDVTVNAGVLWVGFGGPAGAVSGNIINHSVVEFYRSDDTGYAGQITGSGIVEKNGGGTLTLTGSSTYSGITSIFQGSLRIGSDERLPDNSRTIVTSAGALDLNNFNETIGSLEGAGNVLLGSGTLTAGGINTSTTFSGDISGTGGLTKTGVGTLTLSGTNSYSGTTTISGGWLSGNTIADVGVNSSFGTGNIVIVGLTGGGLIPALVYTGASTSTNRNIDLQGGGLAAIRANAGTTLTLTGAITGSGRLSISSGTLRLEGSISHVGDTSIFSTLQLGNSERIADSSSITIAGGIPGGTFDLNSYNETIGSLSGEGNVLLGSGNLTTGGNNSFTNYSGVISGSGGVTKTGSGIFSLAGNNTYTGLTTINQGTLRISANERIADASAVVVNGGSAFSLNNFTETMGSLTGGGGVALGSGALITGGDNSSTQFSGVISGTGGITKSGTGDFHLSGANTYTGGTTITSGSVAALNTSGSATGSGDITIGPSGTLFVGLGGAEGSVSGNITNNGLLTFRRSDNIEYAGQVSGFGTLAKNDEGTLTLTGSNTYIGGTVVYSGALLANNTSGSATGTAPVTVNNGGTLAGTGSIAGRVTVHAGGTIAPGNSPGTLTFTNPASSALEWVMSSNPADTTFSFEINNATGAAGANPGWDTLVLSQGGAVLLAGPGAGMTIEISSLIGDNTPGALSNFDPYVAYVWPFIDTALGFSGTPVEDVNFVVDDAQFAAANGIATGRFSVVQDTPLSLALSFAPFDPADFNLDGVVDGADLTVWTESYGPGSGADADNDGDSDGADFLAWQRQLGAGSTATGSAVGVPEPASALLLLVAGLVVGRLKRAT